MHTKTMEGLVGARTNMNMLKTPMRVYKEAERRGDTGAMERAMHYAKDFADKSVEYRKKVDEGIKEEIKEARETRERKKTENSLEAGRDNPKDTVEISEEGKALSMAASLKREDEMPERNNSSTSQDVMDKAGGENAVNSSMR